MFKLNRLVLTSVFALSLISNVGCGRRVPSTPEPEPSAPAAPADPGQPATPPADPGLPPAPPADPGLPPAPPADPGLPPAPPADPGLPPAPPTSPGQPPADPGAPPPTDPGAPPPAPPANPAVAEFWARMSGAGFSDQAVVTEELLKTVNLRITGWSKGKFATPEENVAELFNTTKGLFEAPPADPAEYGQRSMAFAQNPGGDLVFFVDLQVSTERKDLYVLKYDQATKQILGINEKDLEYSAPVSAMGMVRAQNSGVEGKIFFYAEERGQFLNPARFVPIPKEVLTPQALQAYRVIKAQAVRRNTAMVGAQSYLRR